MTMFPVVIAVCVEEDPQTPKNPLRTKCLPWDRKIYLQNSVFLLINHLENLFTWFDRIRSIPEGKTITK